MKEDVAKGDSDDHWRLGVVAQEVETAGMNGLVKDRLGMGKNMANPIGAILSCAMMMNQLGERKVADIIYKLVEIYTSEGKCFTPDLGGNSKTTEVTKLFIKNIQRLNIKNSRLPSN